MIFPSLEDFSTMLSEAWTLNSLPELTPGQKAKYYTLVRDLLETNTKFNLTAIRDIHGVLYRHLIDSVLVSPLIPQGARVLDLGCGAGFPSLPLAILRNDLRFVCLDATEKKVDFVAKMAASTNLSNVSVYCGRAEESSVIEKLGKFDVVVSRAVAQLNILTELSLPYVKKGGLFLALKGKNGEDELAKAQNALSVMGANAGRIVPMVLKESFFDGTDKEEPCLQVLAVKEKDTPKGYPRRYGVILKKPL